MLGGVLVEESQGRGRGVGVLGRTVSQPGSTTVDPMMVVITPHGNKLPQTSSGPRNNVAVAGYALVECS